MRLISKSLTESVYSAINGKADAKQAVYDVFNGTDFFVNEVYSVGDGLVKFNVTAFDGDGNELNRDVEVSIPNDDYYDIEQDSYDAVFACVESWRDEHNTPDTFYESVTVTTGNTTIISDESGVTVEDNGNTITTGNGATVNVNDTAAEMPVEPIDDVVAVEDEVVEPDVEEVPELEEPAEDELTESEEVKSFEHINDVWNALEACNTLDEINKVLGDVPSKFGSFSVEVIKDGTVAQVTNTFEEHDDIQTEVVDFDIEPKEELEENSTEEFHGTKELARQVFVSLQKDENGKYLVMNDGAVTEEIEASDDSEAIEIFNQKYQKLEDESLNEAEQSIDIFQNPEFDYKITDITVLQPTDSGDVRAIDMNDILVGLDEALTEKYGDANTVVLNSYLTKHGKDYSSAIVDVSAPNFRGYVYTFESSFDGKLYDCIIKETATNKRLEHLCVKSADPVKPFVNAIVEAINVSYKLSEHSSISEDIELIVNKDKVEDNNGVTYTDDTRVEEHNDHVEDNLKDKEKKLKPKKKFEVDDEPDQKNTQGEEIAKINLKETDEDVISKLNALREKLNADEADLDTIAGELDVICDEAGYQGLWEDGLTLMELAKEHIQSEMANDFDNAKSLLLGLENTNAHYAYIDGYARYRNLDKDILDNLIYDAIQELSINEAEELDVVEETPLEEDIKPKAVFHRKPSSVSEMKSAEENGLVTNKSSYVVVNTKELSSTEFEEFSNNLLKEYEWLAELYSTEGVDTSVFKCIEVINADGGNYSVLVDPNGYKYARYAALNGTVEAPVEDTEEPIDEVIE